MAYTPEQWADEQAKRTPDLPWADESRRRVVKPWWEQLKENPFVLPEMRAREILEAVWLERRYVEARIGRKPKVAAALRGMSILGIPCTSVTGAEEKRIEQWLQRLDREGRDMREYLRRQSIRDLHQNYGPPGGDGAGGKFNADAAKEAFQAGKDKLIALLMAEAKAAAEDLAFWEKILADDVAAHKAKQLDDVDDVQKQIDKNGKLGLVEALLLLLLLVLTDILESASAVLLLMEEWSTGSVFPFAFFDGKTQLPPFVENNRVFARAKAQWIYWSWKPYPPLKTSGIGWDFDATAAFLPYKWGGAVMTGGMFSTLDNVLKGTFGNPLHLGDCVVVVLGLDSQEKYKEFVNLGHLDELLDKMGYLTGPVPFLSALAIWVYRASMLGSGGLIAFEDTKWNEPFPVAAAILVPGLQADMTKYPIEYTDPKNMVAVSDKDVGGSVALDGPCIFVTFWPVIHNPLLSLEGRWALPNSFKDLPPDHQKAEAFTYDLKLSAADQKKKNDDLLDAMMLKVNAIISADFLLPIDELWAKGTKPPKTKLVANWMQIMIDKHPGQWLSYRKFLNLADLMGMGADKVVGLDTDLNSANFKKCVDLTSGLVSTGLKP